MTISVKHSFVSAKIDDADATLVRPSNWNAEHTLLMATNKLLGRGTAGTGAAEEITLGTGLSLSGTTLAATAAAATTSAPQGRLTLQSATPVMTTTQSAKTTIFYSPYCGNLIGLYDGTNVVMTSFAELSVGTTDTTKSPAAIGASKVNDWFVWSDAGTIRLGHGPDWTSDTARSAGTALVKVNGLLLNSVALTNGPAASRGTYVGTTRSNASSQLDWIYGAVASNGTAGFFGVWNMYNRHSVASLCGDNTDNWTYASTTIRAANASNTMRHSFVCGLEEDAFEADYSIAGGANNDYVVAGICYDATNAFSGRQGWSITSASSLINQIIGYYATTALGFHFFQAGETANVATATFYGDNGNSARYQSGMRFSGRL